MGAELSIAYAVLTDKGERVLNEDATAVCIESDRLGFVLCDGLGGHGQGDVASQFVVSKIKEELLQGKSIEESILCAQEGLLKKQEEENAGASMKTTVTCLTIEGNHARFGHVGDSRVYLFEKHKYIMRSQDHSVPQMLVSSGEIKEKDIRHHEDRNRLLRVMGTEWDRPKYQITDNIRLTKHTSFLLCSDGFWELIDEKQMCKALKKAVSPEDWLAQMEKVVWLNGKGTNMDNYSAIAVFIR